MTKTHLIGAQWLAGEGEPIESLNPATQKVIWSGHSANAAQVDAAISAARAALPKWSSTKLSTRKQMLCRYRDRLLDEKETIAQAISDDTGKPMWEARTEAATMVGKIDLSVRAYEQRTATISRQLDDHETKLTHRPHGVLAVLGPYNFPGHLPNGHIAPALLAGNTIVFKPSELTPLVGQLLVELLVESGFGDGIVNLVQGAKATGIDLSSHHDLDGLLFTGSAATGKILHKQFGGRPDKILALEMGGNNPLIVDRVIDHKAAAYHIIQSAFITSGQRCTCARRLIVIDNNDNRRLVDTLVNAINNIVVDLPQNDENTFYGPLISNQVAENMLAVQQQLLSSAGLALVEMRRPYGDKPLITPGFIDTTEVTNRGDEEWFGPLLQLIWVADLNEAITVANDTSYGLAAGMLTENEESWQTFYQQARCGILNRNRATTGASGAAPFGGIGSSGNHRPSAFYAADYCAYPTASVIDNDLKLPATLSPGIQL